MKLLEGSKKMLQSIYASIRRFPIALLFSTALAAILMILVEISTYPSNATEEILKRVAMATALGIPLSLCAKMLFERRPRPSSSRLILYYVLSAILPVVYYFLLLKEINMLSTSRYIGISLSLYLCFLFIPYLGNRKNLELYVLKLFISFLITYIYSGILYGGLSAILFALDQLLGIAIKSEIYLYTFFAVALVFGPAYFLAQVPWPKEDLSPKDYSKVFQILLFYIVMPLLGIYTLILYLYFMRIIFTLQWPSGLVSHLVLWYSLILTMVLFFIHPIKEENRWAVFFSKWTPRVVLPILLMMFVSMGIRIKAYGITENRYYVFVLGLWVLGGMVYFLLSKVRKNIFLLISLSVLLCISVLGPISSFNLSRHSQNARLTSVLERNNMLKDHRIEPASSGVSQGDKEQISSILDYFKAQRDLQGVKYLPSNFKMENMEEVFGFAYTPPSPGVENQYFYLTTENNSYSIDISEYDYYYGFSSYLDPEVDSKDSIDVTFNPDSCTIRIEYQGDPLYEKDLTPFIQDLYKKYPSYKGEDILPPQAITFVDESPQGKVKLVFRHIGGQVGNKEKIEIDSLELNVFVKIKAKN